jgi:hypothetical protein
LRHPLEFRLKQTEKPNGKRRPFSVIAGEGKTPQRLKASNYRAFG